MFTSIIALKNDLIKKLLMTLSPDLRAITSANYQEICALKGNLWEFDENTTLTAGQSIFFLLKLDEVPEEIRVLINPIDIQSEQSNIEMFIYEGTNYNTTATPFISFNYNRNIVREPFFKAYREPTGTNKGLLLVDHLIFASTSGSGVNVRRDSGKGGSSKPIFTNKEKTYLLEIKNIGTATTKVEFHSQILEYCETGLI
jgi:hypothetical protein